MIQPTPFQPIHLTLELWLEMCHELSRTVRAGPNKSQSPEQVYERVCATYNAPGRWYHNLAHIDAGVGEWKQHHAAGHFDDPYATLWAWVHHDIALFSEIASLRVAQQHWLNIGWSVIPGQFGHMSFVVMASDHQKLVDYRDAQLSCDFDLMNLALPIKQFELNTQRLIWELPHLEDRIARKAQEAKFWFETVDFLESLVKRGRVFQTDYYQHLEGKARTNIEILVRSAIKLLPQLTLR